MIRGHDSWVWFADFDLVFPCILRVWLFTHTYPENVSTVGNYTIRGALWSWLLTLCVLLSEWCVRFGAGIVVPLECRCKVLVQGVACCQSGVYSLERCWWLRVLLQVLPEGDVWRCCCQIGVCFKPCFGAGMLVSGCGWKVLLEGAVELACWCCCKGWCFRVLQGGYVLYPTRAARVLVKGAAARCRVQLLEWRVRSGAGWWCRCRVLLQGAAVKVVCALWSWHVGAIAGCRCRVLLSDFAQKQQEA